MTMATKMNYYVSKNDTFGRYMVAGKNLKAGELILSEKPTLVGASIGGPLICFNCCRNVTNSGYIFCMKCKNAVICSPKCTGNLHSKEECFALKEKSIHKPILAENSQLIFPLRCLLLKKYNPKIWQDIMELESHLEQRRDSPIWRRHMVTVERVLSEMGFISNDDLKDELVQKICGILDVNTFEVRPSQCNSGIITNPEIHCLRGLYLEAALMAHDCVSNTHLAVDDDFILTIHASVDIPENTPIFFNYSNVLQGNVDRRQHLREGKYFECSCKRCKDPTELDTDLSSLKCHICRKGLIRPSPDKSDWECNECKKIFKSYLIKSTTEEGRRRIENVDQSNIRDMENLLKKLLQTFHANHYLILELQQNLMGSYLRVPPNKHNLSRRITICRGLLTVFSQIELGLSRLKAITLYEMQSAMVDLAHKQYRDKDINADELTANFLLAESTLKEAIKHLLYEPSKSPEGRLAQTALMELKSLRTIIINIQKDSMSANIDEVKPRKKGFKKEIIESSSNIDAKEIMNVQKENRKNDGDGVLENQEQAKTKSKKRNKRRK